VLFVTDRRPVNGMNNHQGKKAMCLTRRGTMVLATFLLMAVLAPSAARAYEKPYDPYPWCAEYGGNRGDGGTNCGFLTLEQCRAAVSGVDGYCEPNQFYNSPSQGHWRKPR
jgi:hypothetical protein